MIKPRETVKNFAPYIAGRPIEEIKRIYKLKKVIKLASNENPYPPPKSVQDAIKNYAGTVNRYPDSNGWQLKKAIAKNFGVKISNVFLGNGTDEIIEILAKAFLEKTDEIIVSKHAFIRYKMAADLMDAKTKTIPMTPHQDTGGGFTHDLKKMALSATKKTKFIFIANPNNPTGTYNTNSEIKEMFEILKKKKLNPVVVFDEAYHDFVEAKDYSSAINYFKKGMKNICVLRTFSKIFALAGLRLGFAIGDEKIFEILERIRPPFNTTLLSQKAGICAIREKNYIKIIKKRILSEKKKLLKKLEISGFEVIPSQTNFLLVNVKNGRSVFKKLLERGVIVRAMDEYELPQYIRVTIGTPEENRIFLRELLHLKK